MTDILRFKLKDLTNEENLKKVYVVTSKTKSVFNRGLDELPKIKNALTRYLTQHPELGEYPIKILPSFPNAYYNFNRNEFVLGLFNASILSHELEHSLSVKDSEAYQKMLTASRGLANLTGKFTIPISIGGSIKLKAPESAEAINKIFDALSVTHGVTSLPTLYEEGKANLNAIIGSDNKWEATKTLLPAYGSYIGNTSLPIGLYQLAKHITKVKD